MNLPAHYAAMREAALRQFAHGAADPDPLIDSAQDNRRGLTLLARPPAPITQAIAALLAELRRAEPTQYYYPATDLHLTILSVISCHPGFTLAAVDAASYRRVVRAALQATPPFTIELAGLTASPGGILVQGFPPDDSLETLRATTRALFQQSGLPQSIDRRYRLQTAHLTIARFRTRPLDYQALIDFVNKYQNQFIGSFEVTSLELVFNDWYQRAANTVLLESYSLSRP